MDYLDFNYRYIKEHSTPGSWRRGYEYHTKNQVVSLKKHNNIVTGLVKGNFKDFYETRLVLKKKGIFPKCNCPLQEEWCKHAVAVALKAVDENSFKEYLESKDLYYKPVQNNKFAMTENPQGSYIFHFNPKRKQNFFSILVMERKEGKVIRDLEKIFKQLLEVQKNNPSFELTSAQKVEFGIFQMLMKFGKHDKKAGWFDIPIQKFNDFFIALSKAEDVIDGKTKAKIKFSQEPWELSLHVNFSTVGNVLTSLYWIRPDYDEVYPFEEIRYFSRQLKWGRYRDIIFPTNVPISILPLDVVKASFSDIKDADGGKFIYEEIPKLREHMKVEIADQLEKLTLEQRPPTNIVNLSMDYDMSMVASLEFEYDGTIVPYSKNTAETPYVTIKRPEDDIIYWVKRNYQHEEMAYRMLLGCKFTPMQTNNLALEKENAIDFYNYYMKQAGEGWVFKEKDNLDVYKLYNKPLKITADIDFSSDTKDSFEVELYGKLDKDKINFDEIYEHITDGSKYFKVKDKGFVAIPSTNVTSLLRSFNSFDAYRNEENKYIVKTFRAGVVSEIKALGIDCKMSRKFTKFWKQISTFATIDDETVSLPKGINANLREYQTKGFHWLWFMYQYGLNTILADDMGLGKTLQALVLLQKAKEVDGSMPSLVICPTSVVFNWEAEIAKFAPDLKCLKLTGTERKELLKEIADYDVIITSYAIIRRDIEKLCKHSFRYIILDESQNIKNASSQTAQAAKRINATHKLAMSGTPLENRLEELWSVFDFLMPGFLFDAAEFNYKYANPIMEKADKVVEKRLKSQIQPFILRRMKRDVAKDLPDKLESVSYCELTPDQKDLYLQVLDSTKEELFKSIEEHGIEKSRMSIFSALLRLRQICCHPRLYDKENQLNISESGKFEQLKEMLLQVTGEGHRILLFSQFVEMLDIVKRWLEMKGIKHEYLTGKTKDRQGAVERFNNDPTIGIFLVSLKAGGTGLNLTGADYVIHYDPWWNPAVEDQATDRAYRIGQTKKVFVYRLITKGTVEEKIQKLKQRKRSLVDSVISVDRNISKSLTFDDLKDIFSVD